MENKKYIYFFEEGSREMKNLLGSKGANLAEMAKIGLPVPVGFIISAKACLDYYANNRLLPPSLEEELEQKMKTLEERTGRKFGSTNKPLLVSVRSGAAVSMPGMMDTILNLGLNDLTVEALAKEANDRRFALDCYRRFLNIFANVVFGLENHYFESALEELKAKEKVKYDYELSSVALEEVILRYKEIVKKQKNMEFPQEPKEQLLLAVKAVFDSWNNQRAIVYRRLNKIPDDLGTAVTVQAMVFGNLGFDCATGVAFTRNPSTGEKEFYGEFLLNAQGEDVVAGVRTPKDVKELKEIMPETYAELLRVAELLENHYGDMQDIEFTIERKKLYLLQTRTGKRTPQAAIKIAVDLVKEGKIDKNTALKRVDPISINQLLHRQVDPQKKPPALAKGLPASPGAATGKIIFEPDEAEKRGQNGEKVILVRPETTPDDIHGIIFAQGVLTSRGGMTSHAAVVARGMGKPCVCGCEALRIDLDHKKVEVNGEILTEGEIITIDGATGEVFKETVPMIEPQLTSELEELLSWADEVRTLKVKANADTPLDAKKAKELGAEGIGLCRTEHMFMGQDRLPFVQKMILAETKEEREKALTKILPFQREDFYEILKVMDGLPITIRLLDPPLHEFLPSEEELLVEVTTLRLKGDNPSLLAEKEGLLREVRRLKEANPMLGHRGCRLGITYPEIYATQAKAIFEACSQLIKEGYQPQVEVEIPLVIDAAELKILREEIDQVAKEVAAKEKVANLAYTVGTMIELPRACVVADEIAKYADFFSFGTNDLTQTTLGFSRDDAEGKFLPYYLHRKILTEDPFMALDEKGVGELMKIAVSKGRSTKQDLEIGICGEHGGDPSSIFFCHKLGLDSVSCSPFRVPVARLAAAQAALS